MTSTTTGWATPSACTFTPRPAEIRRAVFPFGERIAELEVLVGKAVASWTNHTQFVEKRRWHRVPCHRAMLMTPLDDSTGIACAGTEFVTAADISLGGISFVHQQLLPHRRVAVTLLDNEGQHHSIAVELRWCRFTRDAAYRSGGRFLRRMELDLAEALLARLSSSAQAACEPPPTED